MEVDGIIYKSTVEDFLNFMNMDIGGAGKNDFSTIRFKYSSFLSGSTTPSLEIEPPNDYLNFICELRNFGPDNAEEKKELYLSVQSHLNQIVEMILNRKKKKDGTLLSKIDGKRWYYIDAKGNGFLEIFHPDFINDPRPMDVDYWKKVAEWAFLEMIKKFKMEALRFQKCPNCKKLFYQFERTDQRFCTPRCSSSNRQKKFKNKEKNNVKPEG